MKILLTNDDGIHAPGLLALYRTLARDNDVFVVAPEFEQSAVGHSITLADPIKVKKINKNGSFYGYAVSGAPADCVRIAPVELVGQDVDLVVSGINKGANVGVNLLYSGTVSAATEAAIMGLPGLSISLDAFVDPDFSYAAELAVHLASFLISLDLDPKIALNVNVPAIPSSEIKGLAWARQCLSPSGETFSRRIDPRGNTYFWRGTETPPVAVPEDSDYALLSRGYVTLTPLHYDVARHDLLGRLQGLLPDLP